MQAQIMMIVSVFSLASLSSSSNLFPVDPIDKAELEEAGCPVFNFLPKIDIETFLGEWTLHHMSRNWIHHTQKSVEVRGNQIEIKTKESQRPSETCIRMNISPMPPGQSYNNAPIKTTTICPFTHAESNLGCKPSGRKSSPNALWFCTEMTGKVKDADSHFVIADTDNISWALLVKCFPNQGVHWAVFTKTPTLGPNLMKRIFVQIENFGLDMKDLYTFPLRKCYKADLREELYLPYSTKK